ncbi:hypothetical protein HMPREF2767_06720 [Nosocomiicoccus sp. HMSC067E10]|uniref:ABC transporter permease n=1 Tax=Nosocomiicoccus sp. HMSC067E10 TaxID=1739271 RepID=UPI0008B64A71|nr:ABC transporter permease [Nosocomiicoccus sp. HMSC067E10]OFL49032.1 hypothetical protein HMPREF2767_06720 [Nosocomiicoccus sp. HMSC067E10]
MKKIKLGMIPVVAVLLLVILATAFYPAYNPQPKNIPLAIFTQDEGIEQQGEVVNIGEEFVKKVKSNDGDEIEWHEIKNDEELKEGLENKDFIGALVIEKDFTKKAMSSAQSILINHKQAEMKQLIESGKLSEAEIAKMMKNQPDPSEMDEIKPEQANLEIIINQGADAQLSQIATQILNKITDTMNNQISNQSLSILSENDVNVSAAEVEQLTHRVKVEQKIMNEVKDHQANGNAHRVMFVPIWLTSMIISVLSYLIIRNNKDNLEGENRHKLAIALPTMIVITSIVAGFTYVYYMDWVMGFNFNNTLLTATYISIAILGFTSLIVGFLAWIEFATIPIFMLFLFFTMQAVMLPKQMLPTFYQNYVVPWNPFVKYATTLKEILYTGGSLGSGGTVWMFASFAIIGLGLLVISIYTKYKKA